MSETTEIPASRSRRREIAAWALVLVGTGALIWAVSGALGGASARPSERDSESHGSHAEVGQHDGVDPGLSGRSGESMRTTAAGSTTPKSPPGQTSGSTSFTGRTVDAESGTPVEGVRVYVSPSGPNGVSAEFTAVSDAQGNYVVVVSDRTAPVAMRLIAVAAGYVPRAIEQPSQTEPNIFELRSGATITGRVRTPLGRPVAGIRVIAHARRHVLGWPHSEEWLSTIDADSGGTTVTAADGSFRIAGLVEDGAYTIYASKHGYERTTAYWPSAVAPSEDVEIVLQPVASTRLRVVDAKSGSPIRGYGVSVVGGEGFAELSGGTSRNAEELDLSWVTHRKVSPHGADLEKDIAFEITALGYVSKTIRAKALAGRVDVVPVKLEPAAGHRRVRFYLADEANVPISGDFKIVMGDIAYGQFLKLSCDASGRSNAVMAPIGKRRAGVMGGGVSTHWYALEGGVELAVPSPGEDMSEVIDIRLTLPGRRFNLEVVTAAGAACRGYSLSVVPRGRPILGAHSRAWDLPSNEFLKSSGRTWSASDTPSVLLPPGEWTVTANRAGLGLGTTDVHSVSMSAAGTIRIVLDPAREWRPGLRVKRMLRSGR